MKVHSKITVATAAVTANKTMISASKQIIYSISLTIADKSLWKSILYSWIQNLELSWLIEFNT